MSAREKADIGGSIKQQKMNCQGKQNCNNCERKQKCRNCRGKQKCKVKQTCNVNQSKCNLKQKKVHMKQKLCKVCGKEFEHRSSLSRHLRTHGVLPAVVCEICNTSFTRKDSLQKHRRKSKCGKLPSTEICASSTDEEVFVVSGFVHKMFLDLYFISCMFLICVFMLLSQGGGYFWCGHYIKLTLLLENHQNFGRGLSHP